MTYGTEGVQTDEGSEAGGREELLKSDGLEGSGRTGSREISRARVGVASL
jgi:hypothetical protein